MNGGASAVIGRATATLGSATVSAESVDIGALNAATHAAVSFGRIAAIGSVNAGRALDVIGTGDARFDNLISGDATTVMVGGSLVGRDATAGGTLSVMAGSLIDVDTVTSLRDSVNLGARNIDVGATTTALDVSVSTKGLPNSSILLGSVSANRDILLNGATNGINVASLTSGDDIDVTGSGNVTIGSATARGTANGGYGQASDPANLTVTASSGHIAIGTGSARDNVSLSASATLVASGPISAGAAAILAGGSVTTANVTAGTTLNAVSTSGAIMSGALTAGTGVGLRSASSLVTGSIVTTAGAINARSATGALIASARAGGDIVISNAAGALTTGALVSGNDISATSGGTAAISAATATDDIRITAASANLGNLATTGGRDGDSDGNDIVVRTTGALIVDTATTQGETAGASDITLASGAGPVTANTLTALGNVNSTSGGALTVGTSTSGRATMLSGTSINAMTLTAGTDLSAIATGTATIGTARSTGGNAAITGGGAVATTMVGALGDVRIASNGGNVTTGMTTSGSAFTGGTSGGTPAAGDIAINAGGDVTLGGATNAGRNLNVTARNLATVNNVANGQAIALSSADIVVNTTAGRIGEQGRTASVLINSSGTGLTMIGGSGGSGGFRLDNAEAQRIFAGDIIITAGAVSGVQQSAALTTRAPDVILDTLSLTGATGQTGATAGNIGASGRLRIETTGKLRTIGTVTVANLSSANRFQISAAQGIEVDAATGSISLNGTGTIPLGGTLELTAPSVVAASLTAITDVIATSDIRAASDRLARNDNAISDLGSLRANAIIVNVSSGFFVQNSGIREITPFNLGDRRGLTVGTGGLVINASSATARIIISGRQMTASGSFITGLEFLRLTSINGAQLSLGGVAPAGFDTGSTINGCAVLNPASCMPIVATDTIARDVIGSANDNRRRAGNNTDGNFLRFQIKNLEETTNDPVVDDPVTGVGNDDFWAVYDAKECADDQNLAACPKEDVPKQK